ncbi:MAG: glycosyltransferase family 2 protein [Planctomycetota bacterium]
MPCLNEHETVGTCVRKARATMEKFHIRGEVVVADNGSTDGSQEIAGREGARVVAVEKKGYGSALLGGFQAARGRFLIMGDADDSYDFTGLHPFMEKLREGYDLVMGNRFRGGIRPGAMPFLHRYLGNPVLSFLGRLLFPIKVGDWHCGLRGFTKEAVLRMDLRSPGMEFASEIVLKATLFGMRIAEVPTTLSPDGRSGKPHLRTWRDGWRHLRFLLLFSPRWLFLFPGLFLGIAGLALGAWLLPGPRTVGGITFDVHTLLYAAAMLIVGFQLVAFAVSSKVFAVRGGLLPPDPKLERFIRFFTLERGVITGVCLVLLGLAGTFLAVSEWGGTSFGDLDPGHTLRMVIPSVTALAIGVQLIFSSFFLGLLGMKDS